MVKVDGFIPTGAEGEAGAATAAAGEGAAAAGPQAAGATPAPATAVDEAEPMDEDALLQQALAMSMATEEPPADGGADGGANGSIPHTEQVRCLQLPSIAECSRSPLSRPAEPGIVGSPAAFCHTRMAAA